MTDFLIQSLPFGLTLSSALQILVSLLIAGLYALTWKTQQRQTEIQETQNQIMRWQTRLMAAEYEPEVIVEDFSADGNTAEVTLSNVGRGRATGLRLECLLYYKYGEDYSTAFSNQVLGFVITPKNLSLRRLGVRETYISSELGVSASINTNTDNDFLKNSLDTGEDGVVFHTDVELEIQSLSPVMDVSFEQAVKQMVEKWDAEAIGFDFYLNYFDVVDQQTTKRVISVKEIPAEEGITLSDALEKGEKMNHAVSTLVPSNAKPEGLELLEQSTN